MKSPHYFEAGQDRRSRSQGLSAIRRGNQPRGRPKTRRSRFCLEALESRRLLSTITEYPALSSGQNGQPNQITVGSDGNLWFSEPASSDVGVFNPTTKGVSQDLIRVTNAKPLGITSAPGTNGAIWFTLNEVNQFQGGMIVPNSSNPPVFFGRTDINSSAAGIVVLGNDPWFTMPTANQIGTYDPTIPRVTTYSLSPANINVSGFNSMLVTGPDGNLWFTEPGAIGIFSPTSLRVIGQVSLPSGTQTPADITVGPDGNIWFTESVPNPNGPGFVSSAVGVINPTTQELITEITTPPSAQPRGITNAPDGHIWFTESGAGALGVIQVMSDPTKDTVVATLSVPTGVVKNPVPMGITTGPDGNIWFADAGGAIGVATLGMHLAVTNQPPLGVQVGSGFGLTVAVENSAGQVDSAFSGTITVAIGNNAGAGTLSGTISLPASGGVATFSGLSLNAAGNGYTLVVSSAGVISATTNSFDVLTTLPPTITGEQVLFKRKTNRKHKPVGKPIFVGFVFDFSTAMNPATAGTAAEYQVDAFVPKKIKRKKVLVPQFVPVSAIYNASTNSVTLTVSARQAFRRGGQITVIAGGITSAQGVPLDGNNEGIPGDNGMFTILARASGITRA
jgi:virginiamycin B lyase